MVTTFYPPYAFGGDANYVYQLSHALARRGHEVDVIHCVDSYRALAKGEPQGITQEEPGLTIHSITSGVGILSPLMTHLTGYPFFKSRQHFVDWWPGCPTLWHRDQVVHDARALVDLPDACALQIQS
jgi:hypothetical protein